MSFIQGQDMKIRQIRKDRKIKGVLSKKFEKPHTTTFSITREEKQHFGYHQARIVLSLQFPPPFWCVVLLVRLFWSMMLLLHSFAFMFNGGGLVQCTESQGGKPKRKTEAAILLLYRLAGVADFRGAQQRGLYWQRRWRCEWKRNIEKLVDPRASLLLTGELTFSKDQLWTAGKGFYSQKSPGMQLPAQLWEEGEETNIPLQTLRNKNDIIAWMRLHSWVLSLLKLLDLFQRTIGWVRLWAHGVAFEPSQWWREGIVGAFSPLAIVSKRGNF